MPNPKVETGEHRPDPDFDKCPDCHKVYSQCECPMEIEGEEIPDEILSEESDL